MKPRTVKHLNFTR